MGFLALTSQHLFILIKTVSTTVHCNIITCIHALPLLLEQAKQHIVWPMGQWTLLLPPCAPLASRPSAYNGAHGLEREWLPADRD